MHGGRGKATPTPTGVPTIKLPLFTLSLLFPRFRIFKTYLMYVSTLTVGVFRRKRASDPIIDGQ